MFIGHFGVALAAKRLAPRTSLGTLIAGAQFLDLLWPVFLLLGWEHVRVAPGITKVQALDFYDYPFSHSLTMAVRWSLLFGLAYYIVRRYRRGAWVVGSLVLSHWVLDFLVHRPDLPLWPGGPKYGLGLWNSWPASISAEVLLFAAGIWLYSSATRGRDAVGKYGFWSLIAFLFLGWLAATFGPPPPNVHQLALGAMAMWLLVPWAWWADAHRSDLAGLREALASYQGIASAMPQLRPNQTPFRGRGRRSLPMGRVAQRSDGKPHSGCPILRGFSRSVGGRLIAP